MSFIDNKVEEYLNQLMQIDDLLLREIYDEGITDEIPIIQVPSIKLIELMASFIRPKTIIEVGTAIGFSTIWLARVCPYAIVHTIERKLPMIERAKININKSGFGDRIVLHEGDAIGILPTLPKADLIFIDAAKGKYKEFFELSFPLINVGGIFIFDNILFRGYIADDNIVASKPMLRKIRSFNDYLANYHKVKTSFIPIGDGLAISCKLED